jgi:hypothetical protein
MGKERNKNKKNLKYPKAVHAATAGMVLSLVAILGICAYAGVSGYFLGTKMMTSFQTVLGGMGGGGGSGGGGGGSNGSSGSNSSVNPDSPGIHMTNMSSMPAEFAMWILMPINNTGTVGLTITNLVVNVTVTSLNSTLSISAVSHIGTIPFGQSVLANITLFDVPIAVGLSLQYAQPVFNVVMSVGYLVSTMTFGITVTIPGGLGF